jgi:hypothetical protein
MTYSAPGPQAATLSLAKKAHAPEPIFEGARCSLTERQPCRMSRTGDTPSGRRTDHVSDRTPFSLARASRSPRSPCHSLSVNIAGVSKIARRHQPGYVDANSSGSRQLGAVPVDSFRQATPPLVPTPRRQVPGARSVTATTRDSEVDGIERPVQVLTAIDIPHHPLPPRSSTLLELCLPRCRHATERVDAVIALCSPVWAGRVSYRRPGSA